MYTRLLNRPIEIGRSFFLFGPRGTGKTTWLRQRLPGATYLDLLDEGRYVELLGRPQRLAELIGGGVDGQWVVVDEVQRVPALLNEVHRLIEEKGVRFALTGSSARSLRRGGVNLLAGRALTFRMHGLTVAETGDATDLAHLQESGSLPAVLDHPAPDAFLKAYVGTYLREEVMQEGLTRNLAAFSRFLETAAFSQGEQINASQISRECGLDRKTVENYFSILEGLMIGHRVPCFTKRAKRRMASHPKFYFFDAGVYRAVRPMGPLDSPEEAEGPGLETLVMQNLRGVIDGLALDYQVCYWRTNAGVEVDFIVYGALGLFAIEVKRSRRFDRKDLSGLRSFRNDYPMATCMLAYCGEDRYDVDGIAVTPVMDLLAELPALLS